MTHLGSFERTRNGIEIYSYEKELQDYRNKPTTRKNVLGSNLGEGSFFSSATEHDKRTAPRPKLFVSTGRL
jgi:hypothetical protein